MGMPRKNPSAAARIRYIVSADTSIRSRFDAGALLRRLQAEQLSDNGCADRALQAAAQAAFEAQKGKGRKLSVQAFRKAIEADPERVAAALRTQLAQRLIAEFVAGYSQAETDLSAKDLERIPFDKLPEALQAMARATDHKRYVEDAETDYLNLNPDDPPLVFVLRGLDPEERAEIKGAQAEPDPGVSKFKHFYNVARQILSLCWIGVESGWPADWPAPVFAPAASDDMISRIHEDWILELGNFVLGYAELRKSEKKA